MESIRSITRFGISLVFTLFVVLAVYKLIDYSYTKKLQTYALEKSSIRYSSAADIDRQLNCLAKNIYYEAASEPFEGKVAVAQVTLNRARSGAFPNDVCKVVYQKNVIYNKIVCQFSWYCDGQSRFRPVHKALYDDSEEVARRVLLEGFELPGLKDAMYYHADYVNPGWNRKRISKIGRHIFYK